MKNIAANVVLLERVDWGADPAYPRLGGPEDPRGPFALVPRSERFYNIIHHTVGVDSDTTKNVWENMPEIRAMMHRLQLDRPDLGVDVPYNFVAFLMADLSLTICEGRGYDRWGAHTAGVAPSRADPYRYFNGCGIATSYAGDFENYPFDIGPWLPAIKTWLAHLRREIPMLGTRTICGRATCGHKDFAPYHELNRTACPGQHLYVRLGEFTFEGAAAGSLLQYVPALGG